MTPSRTTDYGAIIEPEVIDSETWRLTEDAHERVAEMLANTVDFYISMTGPENGVRVTLRMEAL